MAQRVRVFIRYFATTDASTVGTTALEYLKSLLRIAPVRVLSMSGAMDGPWGYYSQTMATPIGPNYVNVVCCPPARWAWRQRMDVPVILDGKPVATETLSQDLELYTAGVRNVLIMPQAPEGPMQAAAAARYEARIAPHTDIWRDLSEMAKNHLTHIIPVPITSEQDHRKVREIVLSS